MLYTTKYYYIPRYEYTSCNQYGIRFRKISSKKINVVKLSCKREDASGLEDLVVIGHTLNVPVHYDFKENQAYLEIMSGDTVKDTQ